MKDSFEVSFPLEVDIKPLGVVQEMVYSKESMQATGLPNGLAVVTPCEWKLHMLYRSEFHLQCTLNNVFIKQVLLKQLAKPPCNCFG